MKTHEHGLNLKVGVHFKLDQIDKPRFQSDYNLG